jgi:hypothetical protein
MGQTTEARARLARIKQWVLGLCWGLLLWWAMSGPAVAERLPVTPERLADRLAHSQVIDGQEWIDLTQLVIDLTTEEERSQFFTPLAPKLTRRPHPVVLDLSHSVVYGDWSAAPLGTRVKLAPEALRGQLTPPEQERLFPALDSDTTITESFAALPYRTLIRVGLHLTATEFRGRVDFADAIFLRPFNAHGTIFKQGGDWSRTVWGDRADFEAAQFQEMATFEAAWFLAPVLIQNAAIAAGNFNAVQFENTAQFSKTTFNGLTNWLGSRWQQGGDLSQTRWRDRALLNKSLFADTLDCSDATFEKIVTFRGSQFDGGLNAKDVKLLDIMNLSNTQFTHDTNIQLDGLVLDSENAKILGDKGEIGSMIRVSSLPGNEALLLGLIRSFRRLEQIPDANQLDVMRSRLHIQQILAELNAKPWYQLPRHWFKLMTAAGLSVLLLLSNYGTDVGLIFALGLLTCAYFAIAMWIVDRVRRQSPTPLLPNRWEALWMGSSFTIITALSFLILWHRAAQPLFTLLCLSVFLIPIPIALIIPLYQRGRYHNALDQTYLVEDGSLRQLQLLIIRLPIIPRFPFFRDRYQPILCDRRWGWLNYYDFSLNNILKFGFNDIRLRDHDLPGLVSALVWYQWSLGLVYVVLLLWTLSRTIPGLNVFLYLG